MTENHEDDIEDSPMSHDRGGEVYSYPSCCGSSSPYALTLTWQWAAWDIPFLHQIKARISVLEEHRQLQPYGLTGVTLGKREAERTRERHIVKEWWIMLPQKVGKHLVSRNINS